MTVGDWGAPPMNRKRREPEQDEKRSHKKQQVAGSQSKSATKHLLVHKHLLAGLGGGWANAPPFSGDEDRLYRWIAEPALWARIVYGNLEPKLQQRLVQLHAALHTASTPGFVCWRTLQPIKPAPR